MVWYGTVRFNVRLDTVVSWTSLPSQSTQKPEQLDIN